MGQSNVNPFVNTSTLVVEYNDVIKSPWRTMLEVNRNNYKLNELINMGALSTCTPMGIYEWYLNRKNRNPLKELDDDDECTEEGLYEVLENLVNSRPEYTNDSPELEFVNTLRFVIKNKFSTKYFIYDEFNNNFIQGDILRLFPSVSFTILRGSFEECIADIPKDVTWILSDAEKISILEKTGKIDLSSILLARDYRYNYEHGDRSVLRVNIHDIKQNHIFKYGEFISNKLSESELIYMAKQIESIKNRILLG